MPPDADKKLDPPFNGKLVGHLYGSIAAPFSGILTETESDGSHLRGRFAAQLEDIGSLVGHLDGRLDVSTAEVKGRLTGTLYHEGNATKQTVGLRVVGCLRPYRWVSVSQLVRNKPIGGITVQIQVPAPGDKCRYDIPSTDTFVSPKHLTRPTPTLEGVNTGKVVRLIYDCFGDFSGFVLDVCCEEVTFMVRGHGFEKLLREAYENHWTIKVLSKPRTPKCVMGIEVC
jgi:hypothetical protein